MRRPFGCALRAPGVPNPWELGSGGEGGALLYKAWMVPEFPSSALAAPFGDLGADRAHKGIDGHIGLLARPVLDIDVAGLDLLAADNRYVRHLPQLGVPDLAIQPL